MQEKKIDVDGFNINYVQVGHGPKPVLCLPGALGSIWTDFKPQIEGLDRSKFTVVGWDPPGYGKSRPPNRDFPQDFFHLDASIATKLMKELGFKEFSLLGWSDGGITAMIIAGAFPDQVRNLVIWGANAYIVEEELKIYESVRDIDKWSQRMKDPLIALYGEEYFRKTWNGWVNAFESLYRDNKGNICKEMLPCIRCPTLVVHGAKDPMIAPEHPPYLIKNIKDSKLHVFQDGKHNIHLRYAKEFNLIVEEFLSKGVK